MKLHFYLKHFPPHQQDFHEGTTKAVHGLATGLVEQGVEVVVLCEGPMPGSFQSAAGYRIECFPAPHSSPSFRLSPEFQHYVRTQLGPEDLVVLNGIFHQSVYRLSRLLKKVHVPYVMAPHDPYHPAIFQKRAMLKQIYWWLCEKPALQSAQAVQMLDGRHGQWLSERGVHVPQFAVPNGFAPENATVARSTYDFNLEHPRFVFLGRMDTHNKGLDLLIQGFIKVSAPTASLTIQGPDWGDRANLEALVRQLLGTSDRIKFLNPDYTAAASVLLTKYDVFCLASRFEGFSLAALEAMLAGRVLMISEVAGLAPHVAASGCGIVVAPTVKGIQSGIQQLLERRDQWSAMGLRGRDYALKRLDWSVIAQESLEQYRSIALKTGSEIQNSKIDTHENSAINELSNS
jgi:glycosyltransferase involved in cell wall biosynthesis